MFAALKIIKKINKIFFIKNNKNKNIILLEFFNYYPSLIGFGYFLQVLTRIKKAQVICYNPNLDNIFKKIYNKFFANFSIIGKLFQAIGVNRFIFIEKSVSKNTLKKEFVTINNQIKTKHDVIRLKCFGVNVGYEIYDEYLRIYNKTEVDVNDINFRNLLIKMISIIFYWKKYFSEHTVKAVIVSHPVYFTGLIARVAIKFDVPVYCVAAQSFYLINNKNFSKHSSCKKFASSFQKITINKKYFLKLTQKELESRFQGKKDKKALLDQETDQKLFDRYSSFVKIVDNQKKINILVAAHCFSDAIHAYGKSFYTDFHDWLTFLGRVSLNPIYKFYIKIHPAQYDLNYKHFLQFEKKYNFTILPKNLSINNLLKEKLDYVLTIYGSVGHEYPLYGIPVINASNNGPHCGYRFNINPKNRKEYEKLILNLKKNKFKIKSNIKNKIFEFYFMRYISEYSLLDKWNFYLNKLKHKYNSLEIIECFIKNFDIKSHKKKILDVEYFIKSKSIRLVADNSKKISKILTYIK